MSKTTSLRSGMETELQPSEASVSAWQELTNGVPREDGVVPLLSFFSPTEIKRLLTWNSQAVTTLAMGFALVRNDWLYEFGVSAFIGFNFADRSYVYQHEKGLVVNGAVLSGVFGVSQSTSYTYTTGSVINDFNPGNASTCIHDVYSSKVILFRDRIIASTIHLLDLADGRPVNAGTRYPITTLIKSEPALNPANPDLLIPLDDIHNNTLVSLPGTAYAVYAPSSPFFVGLDEYLCVVGGIDNSEGLVVPTASALSRQRLLFRWGAPDTINEWEPDLTNVPAQWFSGNLLLPAVGDVVDVFTAFGNVYVVQEQGLSVITKVGGAIGFSQNLLDLVFSIDFPGYYTCVPTPRGVFFLNTSGLHVFDGASITSVGQKAKSLFTLEYITERWGLGFNVVRNNWGVYRRGLHIPSMSTVIWFIATIDNAVGMVTVLAANGNMLADGVTAPQYSTVLLMYNYETGQSTIAKSPSGVQWFPFTGIRPGISEYTNATGVSRLYELKPKPVGTLVDPILPVADVTWTTGFYSVADAKTEFLINRLFLQYQGLGLDALTVTVNLYSAETTLPDSSVVVGLVSEFTSLRWKDIRVNARFVSFTFTGTPAHSSSELQGIGIDAVMTGSRW